MRLVSLARYPVIGVVALSLALGMTGCGGIGGGGVSKSKVVKALNKEIDNDPTLKSSLPAAKREKFVDCVADVYLKKGNKEDLKAWQDGAIKSSDVRPFTGDQTNNKDLNACTKYAE